MTRKIALMKQTRKLCAGDWVEVRSKAEILATLDKRGQLEGLPFMPEMFQYCGQRLRIYKRAHKTCDPPNGLSGRRMESAVHLENIRCDGSAHAGCQAGCLIFWKEAWLKQVDPDVEKPSANAAAVPALSVQASALNGRCSEADVLAGTRAQGEPANAPDPTYVCQSTQVAAATKPLRWWDPRQYVEDYLSGNVRLSQMIGSFLFFIYHHLAGAGLGFGSALRWAYDVFQKVRGGTPYPWRMGQVPKGVRTPSVKLGLQEGEQVRVKSYPEILQTLDENWNNRGMYFDAEAVPFCNGTFRVLKRVEKIIDEKTGKILRFKNEAIILDDVVCLARYAKCRKFCPRSIYPYWREIWLERAASEPKGNPQTEPSTRG